MKILTSLSKLPPKLTGLTIGTFDGVHKGHQKIFSTLRKLVKEKGRIVALTFPSPPSHLFNPNKKTKLITSLSHKLQLLKGCGVDVLYLLPFTKEFAAKDYNSFIKLLKEQSDLSYLVLGSDATFGKEKEGDKMHVHEVAKKFGIEVHYIEKDHVSSSAIRKAIEKGNFKKAEELLGRPYSLLLEEGKNNYPDLILPHDGVYGNITIEGSSIHSQRPGEYTF